MKKSSVLFLLLSTGIVIGTASGVYYFWRQLTQLPEWYSTGQNNPKTYAQIQKSGATVEEKIEAQIQASPQAAKVNAAVNRPSDEVSSASDDVQVALSSQELNDLLVTKITEKRDGQPLPSSVKGFNAAVKNDKLKTGAVVDIKELQNSGLGEQHQQFLSEITQKIPMSDRKVYIGVEGKPQIQNGKLRFDENARIQVGNMSFTIAEVASRLGVPPEKVQDQLNLELKLRGLTVRDIDFKDGNAILKGDPK
ncbi:hypothetical protein [Leptolyngbya sp. NIES-2104]|uniref:hypothetical protein n=1 Tax=Leptolyngbya sp. NIES-2104 TaxID=1552121 RepID=UPI0006ECC607|nr:hypothetical protein [Leptolyngbya sp. NIES-2104]GAP97443.1 hypothetical protein NIES2104_39900 [Leptolyngbya sp. NIES-2104]